MALFSCFCALLIFSLQETAPCYHTKGSEDNAPPGISCAAEHALRRSRRKSAGGALAAPGRRLLRAAEGEGAEPAASARRGLRGQTGGQKLACAFFCAASRLCETRGVGGKDWTPLAWFWVVFKLAFAEIKFVSFPPVGFNVNLPLLKKRLDFPGIFSKWM